MLIRGRGYRHDPDAVSKACVRQTPHKPRAAAAGTDTDLAVGAGASAVSRVGSFCFWFVGQRWEWSDEVYRIHGLEPGELPRMNRALDFYAPHHRARAVPRFPAFTTEPPAIVTQYS